MPVNNRPPRVLNHFHPVLFLQFLSILAQHHLPYGIRTSQHVIVKYGHFKVNLKGIIFTMSEFYFTSKRETLALKCLKYLVQSVFLNNKNKRFVVIWIKVCIFNRGFLFLSNSFSFWVQQFNLHIRIRSSSNVHLLKLLALQDTNCKLKWSLSAMANNINEKNGVRDHSKPFL